MKRKSSPIHCCEPPISYPSKNSLEGEIISDLKDKKWKIGASIGIGGFGEIYLASDNLTSPVSHQTCYVVKVEPFSSGPLFVETHVYAKIGKKDLIDEYAGSRKLKFLGMPYFLGYGSHIFSDQRYRFIVLPKYGIDLQTVFLNSGKQFSIKTVFTLAVYVLDVLEYIHHNGYVHADIKASNLVLSKDNCTPVYLLDYGLSCKFTDDIGNHKKLESDQRKAHSGTLLFTSRDAHFGAHSRRGDLEILGYNLIMWIAGSLPWEGNNDAEIISDYKTKMMNDLPMFFEECFGKRNMMTPDALMQYLKYINKLKFKSKPDYQYCRKLFIQGVRDVGYTYNGHLSLNVNWLHPSIKGDKCKSNLENNGVKFDRQKSVPIPVVTAVNIRRPCAVRNFNPRLTRKSTHLTVPFDWPKILAGHPEKPTIIFPMYDTYVKPVIENNPFLDNSDSYNSELLYTRGLDNPTPQMKLILQKEFLKTRLGLSNGDKCINNTANSSFVLRERFNSRKNPQIPNIVRNNPYAKSELQGMACCEGNPKRARRTSRSVEKNGTAKSRGQSSSSCSGKQAPFHSTSKTISARKQVSHVSNKCLKKKPVPKQCNGRTCRKSPRIVISTQRNMRTKFSTF